MKFQRWKNPKGHRNRNYSAHETFSCLTYAMKSAIFQIPAQDVGILLQDEGL